MVPKALIIRVINKLRVCGARSRKSVKKVKIVTSYWFRLNDGFLGQTGCHRYRLKKAKPT